jgi:threonine dehydrogenase-like Zn-dependent dehydrogenase
MKTMRAMILTEFGGPDKFALREMPIPQPGPKELLVRVHATSVNPVDFKLRKNGSWAGIVPPAILGYDVSGVVEEVGEGVVDFEPGNEVYYTPEIAGGQGSYAEYHVVDEAIVAPKPTNLSHVEAAAIPLAGGTAWAALIERAGASLGETVLVHGVGGVGSMAVQIANAAGARVLASCGYYMLNDAETLGAYQAINYESDDFITMAQEATEGVRELEEPDSPSGPSAARAVTAGQTGRTDRMGPVTARDRLSDAVNRCGEGPPETGSRRRERQDSLEGRRDVSELVSVRLPTQFQRFATLSNGSPNPIRRFQPGICVSIRIRRDKARQAGGWLAVHDILTGG